MTEPFRIVQFAYGGVAEYGYKALQKIGSVVGIVVPPHFVAEPMRLHSGTKIIYDKPLKNLFDDIRSLEPNLIVICSYDRILPIWFVEQFEIINVHYAPLPGYRGRATVNWAIINDEGFFAATIHRVVPALDAGPILSQRQIAILRSDSVAEVYSKLNGVLPELLKTAIDRIRAREDGENQDERLATYCCTRVPEDGKIEWTRQAREIENLIRASQPPFPYAFTYYQGIRVEIVKASAVRIPNHVGRVPGRVVLRSNQWIVVLAGGGAIRLELIRLPDGQQVAAADLVKSVKTTFSDGVDNRLEMIEERLSQVEEALKIVKKSGAIGVS